MSEFIFKPAERSSMKLLIGVFGLSGGGKTKTALLVARGIVGPNGKIGLVDTENKRATAFQDEIKFLHLDFQPPFHPLRYCEVLRAAEEQGIECLIIDSTTHEWSGEGGYLDLKEEALQRMAGDDWKKREKCAMAAAAQVKPKTHSKFVAAVLRCKMHVIMCFRAHEKVRLTKGDGQTKIEVDETPSPMQDGDLIYEMLIAGEVYSKGGIGGYFRIDGPHCKHTCAEVLRLLPKEGEQFGIKHGELLAQWCNAPKGPGTHKPTADPLKALKKKLWDLTQEKHQGDKAKLQQWLIDEACIDPDWTLDTMTEAQLKGVILNVERKTFPVTP
jgi:hypothetical protein